MSVYNQISRINTNRVVFVYEQEKIVWLTFFPYVTQILDARSDGSIKLSEATHSS